ncbi:serine protease [Enemella evansiae]|nr:serine protease [Enemella evansiae]
MYASDFGGSGMMDAVTAAMLVDLTLVLLLVIQVLIGWQRGLVSTVFGVIGYLGGAVLALWGLSSLLALTSIGPDSTARAIIMLVGVLGLASALHGLTAQLGTRLMARRRADGGGQLDSAGGAVVNVLVTAIVIGLVGMALLPVVPDAWRRTLNDSRVVTATTDRMPPEVVTATSELTRALYDAGFPPVFGNPLDEPRMEAAAPDDGAVTTPGIQRAAASVVKIRASMPGCNRVAEGSGWVAQPRRVVTNAHVIAGADRITLQVGGTGARLPATVIQFDPNRDLAVLDVPSLRAPALQTAPALENGTSTVVAGFPLDGPYDLEPARIRGTVHATGRDIYGSSMVTREIYSIYADVNPGNSGGPLLTEDGRVAGTVFARSTVTPQTGFVLTNDTAEAALTAASSTNRTPVGTGSCATD